MTTCADWKAELARNPRDPSLWEILGDFLEENPEAWEREKCVACGGNGYRRVDDRGEYGHDIYRETCPACNGSGSLTALTAHRARLTAWGLRMEDEQWHGVELCNGCEGHWMREAGHTVPTFALLWDREGPCDLCYLGYCHGDPGPGQKRPKSIGCNGTGKRSIPGHVSELTRYLESQGDTERAARVREIRVASSNEFGQGGHEQWTLTPPEMNPSYARIWFTTYPDACREALRRVVSVFTEECENCNFDGRFYTEPRGHPILSACKICTICFGLGWRATEEKK